MPIATNTKSLIAILTWNRVEALKETLSSLLKFAPGYDVCVFDDCGSKDSTEAYLTENKPAIKHYPEILANEHSGKHFGPNVRIFMGTENIGVAGNSNRAVKIFEQGNYDHLCLMNDDLHVLGDFVAFYRQAHMDLNIGYFCFSDFTSEQYHYVPIPLNGYTVKLLQRRTGIMQSFTRECVTKTGYFDTRLGRFGEEHPCPGNSLVMMGDHTFKPIREIKVGDEVIGWERRATQLLKGRNQTKGPGTPNETRVRATVLGVKVLRRDTVTVKFSSGRSLTCAPEHTWLNYHSGKKGGNKMYIPAEIGRKLVYVAQHQTVDTETKAYKKGYIHGAVNGDGNFAHGVVTQRATNEHILQRLHAFLTDLGIGFTFRSWDYAKKDRTRKRSTTPIDHVLYYTRLAVKPDEFSAWKPANDEEWQGWLGGMYDTDGSWAAIGQTAQAHPAFHRQIIEGLKRFNFVCRVDEKEIHIKGGWRELLRFRNLCGAILSYKFDRILLSGRFRTPDKIVSIEDAAKNEVVYCLKTTSGNYIIQGYASKNCDYANRAAIAGQMSIGGRPQHCIDVEFLDPAKPLLRHQECPSSISGIARQRADLEAGKNLQKYAHEYSTRGAYRPFSIGIIDKVGGYGGGGIPAAHLTGYAGPIREIKR